MRLSPSSLFNSDQHTHCLPAFISTSYRKRKIYYIISYKNRPSDATFSSLSHSLIPNSNFNSLIIIFFSSFYFIILLPSTFNTQNNMRKNLRQEVLRLVILRRRRFFVLLLLLSCTIQVSLRQPAATDSPCDRRK